MLETIRRTVALPRLPLDGVATVATTLAFLWLLVEGAIQPIAVYLLQLYLTF